MLVKFFHTKPSIGSFDAELPSKTHALNRADRVLRAMGITRIECYRKIGDERRLFYIMEREGIDDAFDFFRVDKAGDLIYDKIGSK